MGQLIEDRLNCIELFLVLLAVLCLDAEIDLFPLDAYCASDLPVLCWNFFDGYDLSKFLIM